MKLRYVIILVVALFSTVTLADHELLRKQFKETDLNFDGYITLQEAAIQGGLLSNWDEIDVNADQHVDIEELIAFEVAKTFVPAINADEENLGAEIY